MYSPYITLQCIVQKTFGKIIIALINPIFPCLLQIIIKFSEELVKNWVFTIFFTKFGDASIIEVCDLPMIKHKKRRKIFHIIITEMCDKFVTNLVTNLITKLGDPQIRHQI